MKYLAFVFVLVASSARADFVQGMQKSTEPPADRVSKEHLLELKVMDLEDRIAVLEGQLHQCTSVVEVAKRNERRADLQKLYGIDVTAGDRVSADDGHIERHKPAPKPPTPPPAAKAPSKPKR